MLNRFVIFIAILAATTPSFGIDLLSLQGVWNGECTRGARSIKAQLIIGYTTGTSAPVGSLNGKPLAGILVAKNEIRFTEGAKAFEGRFSADFNQLSAELDKGEKSASCKLGRQFKESDKLCLLNSSSQDQYIWLKSPNGAGGSSTFILRAGQRLEITGDHTGTLCFSGKDFKPPQCPAQLDQKYYACQ